MNKAFEEILDKLKQVPNEYRHEEYNEAIRDVVRFIERYKEKYNNGWIPCSERLPDIKSDVLLTLRSLDIHTGFRANTDGYFYVEGTDDGYISFDNVIAWQPLPEPYKERD